MGKQHEKKPAVAPDNLFVFGIDSAGKPRGARFGEFNDKIVNVAGDMNLTSVQSASAAFTEIAVKLPVAGCTPAARRSCRRSGVTSSTSSMRSWRHQATIVKPTGLNLRQHQRTSRRVRQTSQGFSSADCLEPGTALTWVLSCWRWMAQKTGGGSALF